MSNHLQRLSAAVALIAACPATAFAQSVAYGTTPPVALTSFQIRETYASGIAGGELQTAPEFIPNDIALTFVNTGNVAATSVRFVVDDGVQTQNIVDEGTFKPGVRIAHNFTPDGRLGALENATCQVAEIRFADGSIWRSARGELAHR